MQHYRRAGIRSLSLVFFFSLPKRLPAAALQGWNSFGEVVGKRMKSALSWEMEHGIRERMHFLTGIPAGNAVLWSLPKVQPRRASLLARRTRREKRNRLESCKDNIHQSMRRFRLRLFVSFPFFFFFRSHRPDGGSNRTFWASRDRR